VARWPTQERIKTVASEIRDAFAAGDGHRAVNTAIVSALQPAASFARRTLQPAQRPSGYPVKPSGRDLAAAFDVFLADARRRGGADGSGRRTA
jgi:hypothetical protein